MHEMKSTRFSISLISAVLACTAILVLSSFRKAHSSTGAFVPFTAHLIEEHFPSTESSEPLHTNYITVERQADGSEVTFTSVRSPDSQTAQVVSFSMQFLALRLIWNLLRSRPPRNTILKQNSRTF